VRRAWPLILALCGGCAALRALLPEQRPYGVPAGALRVPGREARAVGVAFDDFASWLATDTAGARAHAEDGGVSPDELKLLQAEWACYERPDFYDTWTSLDDGGTHYIVQISPRPEVCFGKGEELYGGGASYEIDANSFRILKRELSE